MLRCLAAFLIVAPSAAAASSVCLTPHNDFNKAHEQATQGSYMPDQSE